MTKKKIILLGASGSVGSTALRAIVERQEEFEIVGASTHTSSLPFETIKTIWPEAKVCYTGLEGGEEELTKLIEEADADLILNAIAGSAGLKATLCALNMGRDVALANKESVVMGGELLFKVAQDNGAMIIPVDSEHSALDELLKPLKRESIASLILTASGGPFRNLPIEEFAQITVEMALKHPTWQMGPKITIDSATLANKGLEVMEAVYLFNFTPSQIEVVIHPQSVVHALVRLKNGALYGQLSNPDMRLPILIALGADTQKESVTPLNFSNLSLTFEEPNYSKFPLLKLAYKCAERGQSLPIIYNTANEVAVEAFLRERIAFTSIPKVVESTLERFNHYPYSSIEEIEAIDQEGRSLASSICKELW